MKTRFIAAYDTEREGECLPAVRSITAVHERMGVPGTFWVVGQLLEGSEAAEFRAVLGNNPLYHIGSHTYSHAMLMPHPVIAVPVAEDRRRELRLGKELVEQSFAQPCNGFRAAFGFDAGFHADPELVGEIASAGYGYVSSTLWGPQMTLPALLVGPETYAAEGHPDLWEMPGHGWHENWLKMTNRTSSPRRLVLWPMPMPEAVPPGPIETAEDEFAMNKLFIDRAVELGLPYVSFIHHPWSLRKFDPPMRMLKLTFQYVRDIGMEFSTYEEEWKRLKTKASVGPQRGL